MNGLNFNTTDASLITSVYFDNDECQQYHNRLTREEGATLIRIRWYVCLVCFLIRRYGNYGRNVFIEQKTHHEQWVDQVSVKERFQMESEHTKGYLHFLD
jgi:SPX domain protein involved in polyphosphate accumulation